MLKEIRTIIFPQNELEEALKLFHYSVQAILPAGRILSFTASGTNGPALSVNVVSTEGGDITDVTIASAHLAAAMLNYCMKNNIPVARNAKKKIELIGGDLALTLTLEARTLKTVAMAR
jgi:hypothetical protein